MHCITINFICKMSFCGKVTQRRSVRFNESVEKICVESLIGYVPIQEQYIYLRGALTKELTGHQSMIREGEFFTYYNQLKIPNPVTGKTDLEEKFNVNIITQILIIIYSNIHCKCLSNVKVNNETISYLNETNTKPYNDIYWQLIEKLLPGVDEIQCQAAKDINNRLKNRYSNILAGKENGYFIV